MHTRFIYVLLILILIVAAAMLARWLSDYCNQPSVLGELLLGILIGNVGYVIGHPLFVLITIKAVGYYFHSV